MALCWLWSLGRERITTYKYGNNMQLSICETGECGEIIERLTQMWFDFFFLGS